MSTPTALDGTDIQLEPGGKWQCPCGEQHELGGYVSAHWTIDLAHTCDCGRKRKLCEGELSTPKLETKET